MDFLKNNDEKITSLLEGEGSFCQKILSRKSSVGSSSSNLYLYRSPGQVPFQWEMQPGKCKHHLSSSEDIPHINPPPPISETMELSLTPNRARPSPSPRKRAPVWSKVRFWRKLRLVQKNNDKGSVSHDVHGWTRNDEHKNSSSHSEGEDGLFPSPSLASSSSLSSSVSSSSNSSRMPTPRNHSLARDFRKCKWPF